MSANAPHEPSAESTEAGTTTAAATLCDKFNPTEPRNAAKKQVKISANAPTFYEDDTKQGLQLYSTLSRLVVTNPLNQHCYLRDVAMNTHFQQGVPCLVWYDYVRQLVSQRNQLSLLRKLYNQKYYTAQFLFKLQQFLVLQQEVFSDISFYQSYSLAGETSKLPKLNILCKQVVSLLNDLESCSIEKIGASWGRGAQLSSFFMRCRNLFRDLTFDLIQCVRNTRQIILNEIRFCYMFANYRSRVYSVVSHVVQFNDIVFHPVLAEEEGLVITLEEIVAANIKLASTYIARSFHHKVLSAHAKSVPVFGALDKLSDMMDTCAQCSTCNKHGHFLHKYCNGKCGSFLDSISLMLQGAAENRVISRTDNCTSRHVEEQLSRKLLRALDHLAKSSVFYENKLSCGDKGVVLVHEQFFDPTRKNRKKWDDNYTNVIYTCVQRGLPNSWKCIADIPHFQYTIYKLDTGYYSAIASDYAKQLKLSVLNRHVITGFEEILTLITFDVISPEFNDVVIKHLNSLSYLVLSDTVTGRCQVDLLLVFTQHLQNILHYSFIGYNRMFRKLLSTKDYTNLFASMSSFYHLFIFLVSLHKQLAATGDMRVPVYLALDLTARLDYTLQKIELLKAELERVTEDLSSTLYDEMREKLAPDLPTVSYWRKDSYEASTTLYMVTLTNQLIDVSSCCGPLPDPYLTRVHQILVDNAAQLIRKYITSNKKITFSNKGLLKLESDVQKLFETVRETPVSADVVLATADILNLRNDLNSLMLKKKKSTLKTCEDSVGWKHLSVPQLYTHPSAPPTTEDSLKPSRPQSREIFSDSEIVDTDSVSRFLKSRLSRSRLDCTM